LLSSAALAQKGGPNPDPLGDKQHADKSNKGDPDSDDERGRAKVVVKKRVVRVTRTHTVAPAAKKATTAPTKQSAAKPKKAAPRASASSSPPAH
jgi:hypothetical protein